MKKNRRILMVSHVLPPSRIPNGVAEFAYHVSEELARKGHAVNVVCSDADVGGRLTKKTFLQHATSGMNVSPFRHVGNPWYGLSLNLPWVMGRAIDDSDVVLINNLFSPASLVASWLARWKGKPYIFIPQGSFHPAALRNNSKQKQLFIRKIGRPLLRGAAALVATSELEEEICRSRSDQGKPVVTIPLGCAAPPAASGDERETLLDRFPQLTGKRIIFFLGRISPEKGLDLLIEAFTGVAGANPDAVLAIGGGGGTELVDKMKRLAQQTGVGDRILFLGRIDDDLKWSLLRAASVLALPSLNESFGIVAAEALYSEVPVVATQGTPWSILRDENCGRWVETSSDGLQRGLNELLALPSAELKKMGARGNSLAKRRFTWRRVADDFEKLIEEVL